MIVAVILIIAFIYYIISRFSKANRSSQVTSDSNGEKKLLVQSNLSSKALDLQSKLSLHQNATVTVTLDKYVIRESKPLVQKIKLEVDDIEVLRILSEFVTLVVLVRASSDHEELHYRNTISTILPFIPTQRILFYETEIGKVAIVRQLNSSVHVDDDAETCSTLSRFIKDIYLNNEENKYDCNWGTAVRLQNLRDLLSSQKLS